MPKPCARDGRSNPLLQACPRQVAPAGTTSRRGDARGEAPRSHVRRAPGLSSRRLCIPTSRLAGRPWSPAACQQRGATATHVSNRVLGGARTPAPGQQPERAPRAAVQAREEQAVSAPLSCALPPSAPRAPAQLPGLITVSDRRPLLPIKRHKDAQPGDEGPPTSRRSHPTSACPRPLQCLCRDRPGEVQRPALT